mmetsp:Transcript_97810/g.281410  ORF Transcript_97810/g.281410 Transcript_97810/m.281410 type:complete len:265 (-) Transcript_97810:107-901(-)
MGERFRLAAGALQHGLELGRVQGHGTWLVRVDGASDLHARDSVGTRGSRSEPSDICGRRQVRPQGSCCGERRADRMGGQRRQRLEPNPADLASGRLDLVAAKPRLVLPSLLPLGAALVPEGPGRHRRRDASGSPGVDELFLEDIERRSFLVPLRLGGCGGAVLDDSRSPDVGDGPVLALQAKGAFGIHAFRDERVPSIPLVGSASVSAMLKFSLCDGAQDLMRPEPKCLRPNAVGVQEFVGASDAPAEGYAEAGVEGLVRGGQN